jgi:hypothetical protein
LDLAEVVRNYSPRQECVMRQGDAFLFALTTSDITGLKGLGDELLDAVQSVSNEATTEAAREQLRSVGRRRWTATVAMASTKVSVQTPFEKMADAIDKAMVAGRRAGGGRVVVTEL